MFPLLILLFLLFILPKTNQFSVSLPLFDQSTDIYMREEEDEAAGKVDTPLFFSAKPIHININGVNLTRYIITLNQNHVAVPLESRQNNLSTTANSASFSSIPFISSFLNSYFPSFNHSLITHVFLPSTQSFMITNTSYCSSCYGFTAFLSPSQLSTIRSTSYVSHVEEDGIFTLDLNMELPYEVAGNISYSQGANGIVHSYETIYNTGFTAPLYSWGLDRLDQRYLPLDGIYNPLVGSSGEGVTVYLIDTGCLTTHQEIVGRASIVYTIFDNGLMDQQGHGTHTAAKVGGLNVGVAPLVNLACLAVLDSSGSGSYSDVIAAINWIEINAIQPAIMSLSLGGVYSASVNAATLSLMNSGVTCVVAAGNSAQAACSLDINGISPASTPGVIAVGSSASNDSWSYFSNYGNCVSIIGPGTSILSAWGTGNSVYAVASGTSMACPHIAGIAALYLNTQNTANHYQVKEAIECSATQNQIEQVPSNTPNFLSYANVMPCGDQKLILDNSSTSTLPSNYQQIPASDTNNGDKNLSNMNRNGSTVTNASNNPTLGNSPSTSDATGTSISTSSSSTSSNLYPGDNDSITQAPSSSSVSMVSNPLPPSMSIPPSPATPPSTNDNNNNYNNNPPSFGPGPSPAVNSAHASPSPFGIGGFI